MGIFLFLQDSTLFIAGSALAVLATPVWLKLVGAIAAGLAIGAFVTLGHDAAHGVLVEQRWLNNVLARLCFLPSLHNVTLWRLEHHGGHHRFTNVQTLNAWAPLTLDEFKAKGVCGRLLERVYRSGFGFGLYYVVERLVRLTSIPWRDIEGSQTCRSWLDLGLIVTWLGVWVWCCVAFAPGPGHIAAGAAIWWGVIVPFFVGMSLVGFTVYAQHTSVLLPWVSLDQCRFPRLQGATLAIDLRFPQWYNLASHNVMFHPVHHLAAGIPCYHLAAAQRRFNELTEGSGIVQRFTLSYFLETTRRCKLYDYERREWLDFSGRAR